MKNKFVCPDWLEPDAQAEWARVVAAGLVEAGAEYVAALSAYCQSYSRWRAAEQKLTADGTEVVLRDSKGVVTGVVQSPQVAISARAHAQMLAGASALGWTVAAKRKAAQSLVIVGKRGAK